MKKYKIFAAIFVTVLLLSCNEKMDWQYDGRLLTLDEVFIDYNRTKAYLNSCYGPATSGFCPNPNINRASFTDEAHDADDYLSSSDYSHWYNGSITSRTYADYSSDGSPWGNLYNGIRKCNVFLARIDTARAVITAVEKKSWKAQAFSLRALYYLQLIKRYGGVPVIDKPLDENHDFSTDERATFSKVVKFILADCDSALAYPAASFTWTIAANQFGIMTRAVPYAIKSQAVTYAASPLWSDGTYTWAMATDINREALSQCLTNGGYKLFDVVPAATVAQNKYALYFITTSNDLRATDKETIYQSGLASNVWRDAGMPTNLDMVKSGPCPTQDLVDSYEMVANGEAPITGYSDADRLTPIVNSTSGYDPTNPYVGRDPRFVASIYYDGSFRELDNTVDAIAGMKFTATGSFYAINAKCPSWSNNIGNITFTLYRWVTDYATSVAGIPVAQKTFPNFTNDAKLVLQFAQQPIGDYVWELNQGTETVGVRKYDTSTGPSSSVSYFNGVVTTGNYQSEISYDNITFTSLATGTGNSAIRVAKPRKVESFTGGADGISATLRTHTRTGYYLRKFNKWNSTLSSQTDGAVRLFRLAELYLNFAESAYQLVGPDVLVTGTGFSMSARTAVNAVRTRAGMPGFSAGMTNAAFEKKYRNERRIELAFEEHRFFDVRRWKILNQTDKFVTGMRITKAGSTLTYTRFRFPDRNSWSDQWLMYPIDQSEVDKVIGLAGANWQNPGW